MLVKEECNFHINNHTKGGIMSNLQYFLTIYRYWEEESSGSVPPPQLLTYHSDTLHTSDFMFKYTGNQKKHSFVKRYFSHVLTTLNADSLWCSDRNNLVLHANSSILKHKKINNNFKQFLLIQHTFSFMYFYYFF